MPLSNMRIIVRVRGCPNATWSSEVHPDTDVGKIGERFCQHQELPAKACSLLGRGPTVKDMPSTRGKFGVEAETTATFQPTLAFYIGHSLNPSAVSEYLLLSHIWMRAAEDFSQSKHAAALMSPETCSQLAALSSKEVLEIDAHTEIQQDLGIEALTKVSEPIRLLVLCVRHMRSAAVLHGHQAGLTPDRSVLTTLAKLHQLKLQETGGPAPEPVMESRLSRHIALLRSALLVIKASMISAEVHGIPPKPYSAKRALWNTVQGILTEVQITCHAIDAASTLSTAAAPDSHLSKAIEQGQHLSSLIIGLIIPEMRLHLKAQKVSEWQPKEYIPVICCTMMDCLMTRSRSPVLQMLSQSVAKDIASSGGFPLIMALLDLVKFSAKYAFLVLHHLMDKRTLPAEQVHDNAGVLARMQGLRRCSTLLCPLFSEGQEGQLQRAKEAFEERSLTDSSHENGHVSFLCDVVIVMASLLARQPISGPPEGDDCKMLDAQKPWPTPSEAQWTEIQTISCRAMVLLEWCVDESPYKRYSPEERAQFSKLRQALVLLLHQLLLCHLLDPNLNMERIFRFGLVPVMKEWPMQPTDFILVNNLAFALLRRMASDLFVYKAADNAKANDKAKGDANAKRQVEGVSSIWELICRRDLAPDGPFEQIRIAEMLEALHAAPFSKSDARWLSCLAPCKPTTVPALRAVPDLYTILQCMPKLATRLTGCAVWAKGCCAELEAMDNQNMNKGQGAPGPHGYCSKMAESGMFEPMYQLLVNTLQACKTLDDLDLLGLARAVSCVARLLGNLTPTLPKPPSSLPRAVVSFMPFIPRLTDSPQLQEHLMTACLWMVNAMPNSLKQHAKGKNRALVELLHPCVILPLRTQGPPLPETGLMPRRPLMLQPTILGHIMPSVTDFKHLWFTEDRAFQSCVTWFVGTLEFCMKSMTRSTTPEIIGGKYLVSYLKLLRLFTKDFETQQLPQQVEPQEVACGSLQLLFLVVHKFAGINTAMMRLCAPNLINALDFNDVSTLRQLQKTLGNDVQTEMLKVQARHQELLDFLDGDLLPFMEQMRDSPPWDKELSQSLSDESWCKPNMRALQLQKQHMQLLEENGMLSESSAIRVNLCFWSPEDRSKMSLASLRALEGKGASAEDIQMARIMASHKAAMVYAQASEMQASMASAAVGPAKDQKESATATKKQQEEEAQRVSLAQRAADELLVEEEQAAASAAAKKAKKQRQKIKKLQEQQQQLEQQKEEQQVQPGQQEAGLHETGQFKSRQLKSGLLEAGQQKLGLQEAAQLESGLEQGVEVHKVQVQHGKLTPGKQQQAWQEQQQQEATVLLTEGQQEQVQAPAQQKQKKKNRQQQQQDGAVLSAGHTQDAKATVADGAAIAVSAASGNDAAVLHKPSGKAKGKAKPKVPPILPPQKSPAAPKSNSSLDDDHIPSSLAEDSQVGSQPHAQEAVEPQIGNTYTSDRELKSAESAEGRPGQLWNGSGITEQRGSSGAATGLLGLRVDSSRHEGRQPENKKLAHLWHLLCCPITQELMTDPVIAADGYTYERSAMQHWLQQHDTSPVTHHRLAHTTLLYNVAISCAINDEVL